MNLVYFCTIQIRLSLWINFIYNHLLLSNYSQLAQTTLIRDLTHSWYHCNVCTIIKMQDWYCKFLHPFHVSTLTPPEMFFTCDGTTQPFNPLTTGWIQEDQLRTRSRNSDEWSWHSIYPMYFSFRERLWPYRSYLIILRSVLNMIRTQYLYFKNLKKNLL